jgi:hypothetical protein
MALTLQQRVNLVKGAPLTDAVTFIEKCQQQIRRSAQDILHGDLLITNSVFTGHIITQNQANEWALRALRGNMDQIMTPMIMDSPRIPADPANTTDAQFILAVNENLWPFITLIGSGVI